MKTVRQVAILDIIEKQDIETQEELAEALRKRGIAVTQATVSRDIKELRLLKVLSPHGVYKYAAADKAEHGLSDRLIRMLTDSVLSITSANNLIVVKTLSGSANVAGEEESHTQERDRLRHGEKIRSALSAAESALSVGLSLIHI